MTIKMPLLWCAFMMAWFGQFGWCVKLHGRVRLFFFNLKPTLDGRVRCPPSCPIIYYIKQRQFLVLNFDPIQILIQSYQKISGYHLFFYWFSFFVCSFCLVLDLFIFFFSFLLLLTGLSEPLPNLPNPPRLQTAPGEWWVAHVPVRRFWWTQLSVFKEGGTNGGYHDL